MKKLFTITSIVLVLSILGLLLFFMDGFWGNPISKRIAEKSLERYILENYSEKDYIIENMDYNFKFGGYIADMKSPTSIDSHFTIYITKTGDIEIDTYEDVIDGWNTYLRIDEEYSNIIEDAFTSNDFKLVNKMGYGGLELYNIDEDVVFKNINYGIKIKDLEIDKIYNIKELGKNYGHIIYYAEDNEISFEKAADILLYLKGFLDEKGINFRGIDLILEKPINKDDNLNEDNRSINISSFLYDEIYEEGLEERIEENHNELIEFYNRLDDKKIDLDLIK